MITKIFKYVLFVPFIALISGVGLISIGYMLKVRFQRYSKMKLVILTGTVFLLILLPPPLIITWLNDSYLCLGGVFTIGWYTTMIWILYYSTIRNNQNSQPENSDNSSGF